MNDVSVNREGLGRSIDYHTSAYGYYNPNSLGLPAWGLRLPPHAR